MELENASPSEVNETIQSTEESTTPVDNSTAPSSEELSTEAPNVESTPEFVPNMEYKYRKESHQIPEVFKAIIKDEESNEMVRKLHEKAMGLDLVSESRDKARNELASYRQEVTPIVQKYQDMQHFLEKGDVNSAFTVAGFTKDQIVEQAIKFLEMEQLPESQRNSYDPQIAIQQRELERQNELLNQQMEQIVAQNVQQEFHQVASQHSSAISAFEAQNGQGSFMSMVALYGNQQESAGRQLSIADAVNEVMTKFNVSSFAPQVPETASPQLNTNTQTAPKTFPKVTTSSSGGSASPVAKNIQSFADLQKLSDSIGA